MSVRRETWVALAASLVVAVVMTWPTMVHPASTVPGDLGDPLLEVWTMGWDGHALLHQLGHPFDANIFYPLRDSLGFTDSLFGYAPLGLIGHGPGAAMVRYNIAFEISFTVCGWGAYLLARQLRVRPAAAAVAGAAYAYAPWRAAQIGHLQILTAGAVPLALALLARGHGFGAGGRNRPTLEAVRPGLALVGWLVAAWQLTIGFGVGLQWAYLLLGLTLVTIVWWIAGGRPQIPRALLIRDVVGLAVFGFTGIVFGLPYLVAVHDHPEARRTVADIALFSPPARGFLVTPGTNRVWGSLESGVRAAGGYNSEMTLGLGLVIVVLAILGLVVGPWSPTRRLMLGVSVVVLLLFAMGTRGPAGGRYTYLLLYEHAPGFAGIRTSGRLVVTASVGLALLASHGAQAILGAVERRLAGVRWAQVTGVALAGLVLIEGSFAIAHPSPPPEPVAALHTGSGPLMVVPSDDADDDATMLWTTDDYQPIVNGSSGFDPTLTVELRQAASAFPVSGVAQLRAAGIARVAVLLYRYAPSDRAYFLGALPPGVTRTVVGDVAVFQIGGRAVARHA